MSCILPSRCTSVGLGFKGIEMVIKWGAVASNVHTIYRDVCKNQVQILGIFEHTGRSEVHGQVGLGVTPVGLGFKGLEMA